ncbi:PAS domain S-box protein [Rhizobium sp. LjRoot98]|uniref:PAS domain S-box protein n=1 Tax=Rhizobium sp. LjRoot98 TaxID=3342345 RepID=UPI003ECD502C
MEASETIRLLEERLARAEAQLAEKSRLEAAARESDTRHRLLLGTWAQAVWETDAAGVVTADSPSWGAYTGQTEDGWLGYGWLDAIHPDDRAYAERQWREAMAARSLVNAEFRLRAPDGGWRWTNVRAAPVIDKAGGIEKWAGMNIDIDAHKRAEAELRESEAKYRSLFETMGQGYAELKIIRGPDGRPLDIRYLELNPQYERLTGISVAEARGRTLLEMIPDLDVWWIQEYDRIARSGLPGQVENEVATTGRWYEAKIYPQAGDRFSILSDEISVRKKAEKALREREADLARVQRIGEVGGLDIDIAHGLRSARSPEYLRLHGLPQDGREESHSDWLARVCPDDRDGAERALFDAPESDTLSYDSEYRIVRPSDGSVRWIHARADIERDADGKAVRLVGAHTDVTEQKRSTEALRESEARLAAAFQSVPAGVAVVDMYGRVILSNAEYRRFLPNSVTASRDAENTFRWRAWDPLGTALAPEDWPSARALRGEIVTPGQDMLFTDERGREIWTKVATAPIRDHGGNVTGVVSVIGDIDMAKRAQEALGESEARYHALFESMDEAYAVVDVLKDEAGAWVDFRFVEVNPAFIAHTSMPYPVGQTATELLGAPNPRWTQLYGRALDTGEAIRIEEAEPTLDRVFDLNIFTLDRERNRVAVLFTNITERKRAEVALRESDDRQAFLLKLSDALRAITDPDLVADEACRLLVKELNGSRAQYTVMIDNTPGAEIAEVRGESLGSGPLLVRRFLMNAYGVKLVDLLRSGRNVILTDIEADDRITDEQRDVLRNAASPSAISVPLLREGRIAITLTLHDRQPREWTKQEISLVEDVAERTWAAVERANAEAALRRSEERFQQFANASASGLWIRDAETLRMEFVSAAIATIYGTAPEALIGD